jgi:hypothetical protein
METYGTWRWQAFVDGQRLTLIEPKNAAELGCVTVRGLTNNGYLRAIRLVFGKLANG